MKSKLVSLCLIAALLVVAAGSFSTARAQEGREQVTIWHYWGDTGTNAETVQNFRALNQPGQVLAEHPLHSHG